MTPENLDFIKFLFEILQTAIVPAVYLLWKIDKRLSRVEWQLDNPGSVACPVKPK